MRINTNLTALNTYNSYTAANNKIADSVAKLSSGYAINSASDNAAGLAISEKMRAQIRGLDTAASNSQDAISLTQTAEGALEAADEILQRMRELAVQSASDTNEDSIDREALQSEFEQLQSELDEISEDTTFNNKNLLDGSLSDANNYVTANAITGLNNICVGQADVGTYTVSVTDHAAVSAAVTTAGVAAAETITDAGTGIALTADSIAATSAYNDNTYTLQVSGSDTDSMDFTLVDSEGNTIATDEDVDCSALEASGGTVSLSFTDLGTFTLTASADLTASDITGESGTTIAFDDAGVDEVVTEAKAAYATLSINGESVDIHSGDTSAVFAEQGISFTFDAISDTDVADATTYFTGGDIVVNSSSGDTLTVQTGANSGDSLDISISGCSSDDLGVSLLDISSQASASAAIDVVDNAINDVSSQRAYLGAIQNRLDYKIDNLETSSQNLTSAESSIRDVDMAAEMTKFTNANILSQGLYGHARSGQLPPAERFVSARLTVYPLSHHHIVTIAAGRKTGLSPAFLFCCFI